MGYLVFQETEENDFKVIDGQQRLTTFSLLILAAIKRLRELGNEDDRIGQAFKNYIGDKDLIDLKVENKLALNRNNDYYYRELVNEKEIPKRKIIKPYASWEELKIISMSVFLNFLIALK